MRKRFTQARKNDENPEWTDADFKRAIAFSKLPESLQSRLSKIQRGRPKAAVTKERITIRLSQEVLERFRSGGSGWQTRIDSALKDWLQDKGI
jgi:uncharacterized protein (DUF4415 family)